MSRSFRRIATRLNLALEHLDTVDKALHGVRSKANMAAVNHSVKQNCSSAVQALYGQLNEYLKDVLSEMFIKRPIEIVSQVTGSLSFRDIVNLGTYEAISNRMMDDVFRSLEASSERNMRALVKKVLSTTNVQVEKEVMRDAMFYIDVRHLIVHQRGIIDAKFEALYSDRKPHLKKGHHLPINIGMSKSGIQAIQKLCESIDAELCLSGFLNS